MQNSASRLSRNIINAHMKNKILTKDDLFIKKDLSFAFYDKNGKKILGNLNDKIEFLRKFYKDKDGFIFIDKNTLGHLGVHYVVVKEHSFFNKIEKSKKEIFFVFFILYSIITLIGYKLAKLFIKPIQNERIKLNNFVKDSTHELNTPITALLMCAGAPNPSSEKNLQRIVVSAKRVSEIYKDLTYLFLRDKEEIKNEITRLDLAINEQLDYFMILAKKKKITIASQLEEVSFPIEKESFVRIINNLISNGIKYNKIGGKIEIFLNKKSLTIKDNGIGVEEKKLQDIFKRFYRGTKTGGGFGIGLDIVSNLCNKYNIKINATSKINEGTTFILNLHDNYT